MTVQDTEILGGPPWPIEGRRKQILDFIRRYKIKNGIAPSRYEIVAHLSTGVGSVQHYLHQLEEDGWIMHPLDAPYTKRNLLLAGEVQLPPDESKELLGRIERVRAGKEDAVRFLNYLEKLILSRQFLHDKDKENGKPTGEAV